MSNPSRIFRPSLLLLMLSAAFLAEQVKAGQFDGLYVGMSKTQEEQNKKTWQEFYPGLEAEINDAFKQAQKTGTFLFESNKVPIAWNVTESNNIEVNSIFAGYFISRNVPPLNIYPLFPGLTVESQNISIRAGNDLIVSPIEKQQEGFGYAFHVGPDQTATLTAGDKIIFNAPRITGDFSTQDENSILMGYKSKAQLSAKSIMIFGGMSALSGSHTKISAQKGIYFLVPYERSGGSRAPIALENAELHLYAPDILIQRSVKLGYFIHDKQQPGFLKIGHHKSATKQTNNVFIDGPVSILYESQLQIDAKKTVVFNDLLDISRDAQAQVKANKINIEKLKVGHTFAGSGDSSQVNFSVTDNGTMIIHEGANVTGGSNLNINLGQNAGLLGAFQKDDKSQINISMGSDSYWKAPQSSSVSEISVSPSSYIQLGETGQSISITTDRYTGSGSVLYLPSGSASSLTIAQDSEGSHKVLLDSTGKNLRDTKYIYHIVVDEDSPLENRKAFFALANNGIVDAGPYEYKLGLYQFKRNKDKLWVILAQQNQKHPPIDPPTPVLPDEPLPPSEEEDLPDLPFNPDSPPLEDISLIKPVGLSPAGKLVLASVSSGTQVMQFLGTTDELRSRMGEIRDGGGVRTLCAI